MGLVSESSKQEDLRTVGSSKLPGYLYSNGLFCWNRNIETMVKASGFLLWKFTVIFPSISFRGIYCYSCDVPDQAKTRVSCKCLLENFCSTESCFLVATFYGNIKFHDIYGSVCHEADGLLACFSNLIHIHTILKLFQVHEL